MITLTEQMFLQPTLSLYFGGSGVMVGDRLLTMMESLAPDERALIEPFFIDSQEPALRDHARSRHYCYTNFNTFYEPIYAEFSEQRFPENVGVNPVMNSCEGCGVTRIFGAASLVACRDDFSLLVEQAAGRLQKRRRIDTQPMQVFMTASACGGTGAGMIIDAAALVRHFFRSRGENPRIFLFLIGPSVFCNDPRIRLREDQRARMRASTYALLKELHHFAQGHPFRSAYRLRDKVIDIGNQRDDDRLFDWVYYVDGKPEGAGATRSVGEVAWTLAEAQIHLCATEVGRKVAESMPNQREERMLEFPLHFIHPDNRGKLSDAGKRQLGEASRKTFLASLAVRNVRFPLDEIKTWLRWGWVRETIEKELDRPRDSEERALVEQFEEILGYRGGRMLADGLLASLELTPDLLLAHVKGDADPEKEFPRLQPGTAPATAAENAESLIATGQLVVADIRRDASLVTPTAGQDPSKLTPALVLVERALRRLDDFWANGLARDGVIGSRLWDVACHPDSGRGVRYLDKLIEYLTDMLTQEGIRRREQPSTDGVSDVLRAFAGKIQSLRKQIQIDERGALKRLSRRAMKAAGLRNDTLGEPVKKAARNVITDAAGLRQRLIALRRKQIGDALAARAWLAASSALRRWREEQLAPVIVALENAFSYAGTRMTLAHQALGTREGSNARGRWEALTTIQIVEDDMLDAFRKKIALDVRSLALAPLHGDGITEAEDRLTVRDFASFEHERASAILFIHLDRGTREKLTFLDQAWEMEGFARKLKTMAARALDSGAEPLLSFSRASVGQQLQSYLLRPHDFQAEAPFGQKLATMTPLDSRDPLQLTAVTFVFGIPPNTLADIEELFQQYTIHVGDQAQYIGTPDRWPLHVFRGAAVGFDEVYSPLMFDPNGGAAERVREAADALWGGNGGIKLDIRHFDPERLAADRNLFIELTEKILHYLALNPDKAKNLFSNGRFGDLERLYNGRY